MHDSNNIASTSDSSKLPYRKDIQGLRALSILLVIAAHAKIPGLKGGFIGVDVFFVISGYLITGLLIQELTKNSQINLLRFYARRLKRLLPALALVVTVTALLASRLLTPMEQPHQAISAAAAIFWVSNILFVLQDLNYFDGQAEQNIYLHTWSLGVEEQFYLVWPILLTIVFWATKGRRGLRTALISAFAIIGALSLIACIWQTSQDARLAFYLTPFRAWQFCAGSIAFLLRQRFVLIERRIIDFASIVGIILIIGSAILLSQSIPYPGILSVIPTAGAALVLISGSENKRTVVDNILQSRLAQGIGNISYSWYLWHWPVLGIGYLFLSPQKLTNSILLILIAWILAVATYFLIENPIRQNKKLINFNGWQIVGSLTLMALINISAINWFNQMDQQIKASPSDFYADAKNDMPIIYRMGCDDWYQSADVKLCSFGDQRAANTAAIIGDSIGLQWFPALHKIYGKPDWKIVVATKSACPMVDEDFYYQRIGRTYTECSKWRNALMATLKQIKPNVIIFGSAETYDFTADQWTHGTGRVLRQISQSTDKAYVIRATPGLPFDGPQCLAALKIRAAEKIKDTNCSATNLHSQSNAWASIREVANNFANVFPVDLNNAICPEGICRAQINGAVVYRDSLHLTASFVESLSKELELEINAAE